MALKRLENVAETTPSVRKEMIPEFKVDGTLISRFNAAVERAKDAATTQGELRAKILQRSLQHLFEFNIANSTSPATSIKLIQDNPEPEAPRKGLLPDKPVVGDGEAVRISFQNKYSAADPDSADDVFASLLKQTRSKKTVNDFVQETVTASFDSKVFNVGENGAFSPKVFAAYEAVIEAVTKTLVVQGLLPQGMKSPLGTAKKVLPLSTFHAERWDVFPTADAQEQLFEVLPNVVTITPVK